MSHATLLPPDLGSFCRLDELGLQVVGQRLEPGRAVLACRVVQTDEFARWFGRSGYLRWIDATTRHPDLRAVRIAEVVDLLAAGIKQRPRS